MAEVRLGDSDKALTDLDPDQPVPSKGLAWAVYQSIGVGRGEFERLWANTVLDPRCPE